MGSSIPTKTGLKNGLLCGLELETWVPVTARDGATYSPAAAKTVPPRIRASKTALSDVLYLQEIDNKQPGEIRKVVLLLHRRYIEDFYICSVCSFVIKEL